MTGGVNRDVRGQDRKGEERERGSYTIDVTPA